RLRPRLHPTPARGHGRNLANRGLLELFATIAASATHPAHPAHAFIKRRHTDNLASDLQQAIDSGDVAPLTPAEIDIEVRLVAAVLEESRCAGSLTVYDVTASAETYIHRTVTAWRSSRR
ncbi:MAG TPA: hypothetical protein VFP34_20035, partial [Microlunatus sp.]|nr:hypothetical protein [Microlunatus sp.]